LKSYLAVFSLRRLRRKAKQPAAASSIGGWALGTPFRIGL
jgi:GH18 family chitinase